MNSILEEGLAFGVGGEALAVPASSSRVGSQQKMSLMSFATRMEAVYMAVEASRCVLSCVCDFAIMVRWRRGGRGEGGNEKGGEATVRRRGD
eukprot:8163520-Pyramimonas_sp.AAC.1